MLLAGPGKPVKLDSLLKKEFQNQVPGSPGSLKIRLWDTQQKIVRQGILGSRARCGAGWRRGHRCTIKTRRYILITWQQCVWLFCFRYTLDEATKVFVADETNNATFDPRNVDVATNFNPRRESRTPHAEIFNSNIWKARKLFYLKNLF